jgi:hypothetical protein
MAVSFIGGGNGSTRRKPRTFQPVTDKLYHIMLYILPWVGFKLTITKEVSETNTYTKGKKHVFLKTTIRKLNKNLTR